MDDLKRDWGEMITSQQELLTALMESCDGSTGNIIAACVAALRITRNGLPFALVVTYDAEGTQQVMSFGGGGSEPFVAEVEKVAQAQVSKLSELLSTKSQEEKIDKNDPRMKMN